MAGFIEVTGIDGSMKLLKIAEISDVQYFEGKGVVVRHAHGTARVTEPFSYFREKLMRPLFAYLNSGDAGAPSDAD